MSNEGVPVDQHPELRSAIEASLDALLVCARRLPDDLGQEGATAILEDVLILAETLCVRIAEQPVDLGGGEGLNDAKVQESMLSKSRALVSETMELKAGNQRNPERVRQAVGELAAIAGPMPPSGAEALHPRVRVRGDATPLAGRVLLVDSDENTREVLRHLHKEGYYVEFAPDAAAALERLKAAPFDAALLALVLPGSDGLEMVDAIRAEQDLNQTAILILSTTQNAPAIADCIRHGADDYLFEPFDPFLLEARLRATLERKRLRDREKSRNLELDRTVAALKRSREDLQRFAYAASHDLQAPVRTITTYLQLLQRRLGSRLNEDELEMIGFAQGASRRMHILIEDLLSYSRASTAPLHLERLDSQKLLNGLLEDFQGPIDEAGANVTSDRLPSILTDCASLRQILSSLLNNALMYRSKEPLRIHVAAVAVGDHRENGYWQFSVRDNGQGIPSEYAKQIFVMFKRLHGDEIPGSGIGLTICQRLLERLGGRIWVDSEPGRGSTFYFTIPAGDAA